MIEFCGRCWHVHLKTEDICPCKCHNPEDKIPIYYELPDIVDLTNKKNITTNFSSPVKLKFKGKSK